ncbi:MAG: hypothetical protein ACTIMJ_03730 [Weissella hellenica]|uniref:hypothetical protein n=1 Tax=Weissella hellenica TaxID=46256 RepID=UPI003F947492
MKKPAMAYYYDMYRGGYTDIWLHESGAEAIKDMRNMGNNIFPNAIGGREHKSIPKNGELTIGFPFRRIGCRYLEPNEVKIMHDDNVGFKKADGKLIVAEVES